MVLALLCIVALGIFTFRVFTLGILALLRVFAFREEFALLCVFIFVEKLALWSILALLSILALSIFALLAVLALGRVRFLGVFALRVLSAPCLIELGIVLRRIEESAVLLLVRIAVLALFVAIPGFGAHGDAESLHVLRIALVLSVPVVLLLALGRGLVVLPKLVILCVVDVLLVLCIVDKLALRGIVSLRILVVLCIVLSILVVPLRVPLAVVILALG